MLALYHMRSYAWLYLECVILIICFNRLSVYIHLFDSWISSFIQKRDHYCKNLRDTSLLQNKLSSDMLTTLAYSNKLSKIDYNLFQNLYA
jgi:hypothetical protein